MLIIQRQILYLSMKSFRFDKILDSFVCSFMVQKYYYMEWYLSFKQCIVNGDFIYWKIQILDINSSPCKICLIHDGSVDAQNRKQNHCV